MNNESDRDTRESRDGDSDEITAPLAPAAGETPSATSTPSAASTMGSYESRQRQRELMAELHRLTGELERRMTLDSRISDRSWRAQAYVS